MEALASVGVTKQKSSVSTEKKPMNYVSNKPKKKRAAFDALEREITAKLAEIVTRDSELGKSI